MPYKVTIEYTPSKNDQHKRDGVLSASASDFTNPGRAIAAAVAMLHGADETGPAVIAQTVAAFSQIDKLQPSDVSSWAAFCRAASKCQSELQSKACRALFDGQQPEEAVKLQKPASVLR